MQRTGYNLAIPRIQLIKEFMKQIIILFYLFNTNTLYSIYLTHILNDTKVIFSLGPICDQKLTLT